MEPSWRQTGKYRRWELPALLRSFVLRLCDGRLELVTDGVTRSIWLDAGQIRAVVSELVEERLGVWLEHRGVLNQQQVDVALGRLHEGALFGTALIAEGYLELDRLQEELEARVVAILSRLLPTTGSFRFHAGERFPFDSLELSSTSASFLMRATREIEAVAELKGIVDETGYLRATQDPRAALQNARMLPHEGFLYSRIDGTTNLATLRRMVPLPPEALIRSVVALWAGGFVEISEGPAERVTPPVPPPAAAEVPRAAEPRFQATGYTPLQRTEREEILRLAVDIRFQSHYHRLRIETTAPTDLVKRAFGELARKYHPDRTSEPHLGFLRRELAEIYHCIEDAAEVLLDPEQRALYDTKLKEKRTLTDDPFGGEASRHEARREIVAANMRKADELMRIGDMGGAVTLLEQAARYDPQPQTLVTLARVQLKNPMWINRAMDHLRHAVACDPRCTEAWLEMARFWARRRQVARSRECLDKILAYDPANRDAQETLHELKAR